jgi:catechol 2,3-dioxygenase-like lactoylglutathione lyase family enzyme
VQPRIDVITLAVSDLDRSLRFCRHGLGLKSPGVIGNQFTGDAVNPAGAVAMFDLAGGLILALYPRSELAKDANVPLGPPNSCEFSIGHAVPSKAEVDALLAQAPERARTALPPASPPPLPHGALARAPSPACAAARD